MKVGKVNVPAFGTHAITGAEVVGIVNDWWDPNNVGLCVTAAYRAINTPGNPWPNDAPGGYAASLINNANPGVNDLTESNGGVPWAALTGWSFVAAFQQTLDTGLMPQNTWTVMIQFDNIGELWTILAGAGDSLLGAPHVFRFQPNSGTRRYYHSWNWLGIAPPVLTGNMAIRGYDCYYNGGLDGAIAVIAFNTDSQFRFGGSYIPGNWITADIWAVALYNCLLTPAQIGAVATAMAQL